MNEKEFEEEFKKALEKDHYVRIVLKKKNNVIMADDYNDYFAEVNNINIIYFFLKNSLSGICKLKDIKKLISMKKSEGRKAVFKPLKNKTLNSFLYVSTKHFKYGYMHVENGLFVFRDKKQIVSLINQLRILHEVV